MVWTSSGSTLRGWVAGLGMTLVRSSQQACFSVLIPLVPSDWSFEQLEKHSKELQSLLGNYLLRVTSARITATAAAGFEDFQAGDVPSHPSNLELARETEALPARVKELMDNLELADALSAILDVLKLVSPMLLPTHDSGRGSTPPVQANKVITDIAPWSKTCPPALVYEARKTALDALRVAGVCLKPFVPETSERLLDALGLSEQERTFGSVLQKEEGDKWQQREVKAVRLF
jgi:methionyl-tRNA synthetase